VSESIPPELCDPLAHARGYLVGGPVATSVSESIPPEPGDPLAHARRASRSPANCFVKCVADRLFFRMGLLMRGFRGIAAVILAVLPVGCATRPRFPEPRIANGDLGAFYKESAGVPRSEVAAPEFRDSGPEIRREMLELIRGARHSILVDSFLLNDGPASREVLDALVEKSRQGVVVRVLGDASSRFVREEEAFTYLSDQGVPTAEFNPVRGWRLFVPHAIFERDHRKFWIVDGRRIFLGGANLSDLSLIPPEEGGNRDLMVRFDSPGVGRELTRSFVSTWNESRAPRPLSIDELNLDRPTSRVGGTGCWIFNQDSVPMNPSLTEVMFDGLFASATRTVWLVEPYTFTNPEIIKSVREMTARGVEVNLVLSTQVRAPRFRYASFYGILDLIEAGARVPFTTCAPWSSTGWPSWARRISIIAPSGFPGN
jgi:cardiolipin synthase